MKVLAYLIILKNK